MIKKLTLIDLLGCIFIISGIVSVLLSITNELESYHIVWLTPIIAYSFLWMYSLHASWPKHAIIFRSMPYWSRAISSVIVIITATASLGALLVPEQKLSILYVYSAVAAFAGSVRLMVAYITTKYVPFKFEN